MLMSVWDKWKTVWQRHERNKNIVEFRSQSINVQPFSFVIPVLHSAYVG
jgi:hypothetical protein